MNNQFPQKIEFLADRALQKSRALFETLEEVSFYNTQKILSAFREHKISEYHFRNTSGYGYGDAGREKLDEIWADIFESEAALVRGHFVSGTHALASVLFGILRSGDEIIAVTGTPYDTMQTVIGLKKPVSGSLLDIGVQYKEVAMLDTGVDLAEVAKSVTAKTRMVLIQRSRGYSLRPPLSVQDIAAVCKCVKAKNPHCICFVDNCYGEFVEKKEPSGVGADIIAGSLIKNPGGGIATSGGYVAGKADLVKLAAARLTAPGLGAELGASVGGNRLFYQGLFLAPHVTIQALKSAIFASVLFADMGYNTLPSADQKRSDIIQAIELGSAEKMVAFCQGLQNWSPVDAYVRPEPGDIPGYTDKVIMAGGTFVQGSSIELSADGPIRPPYVVYLQGGLTFEHAVLGVKGAAAAILAI